MRSKLESCINFSNNDKIEISGYELSKLLIRNGGKLNLKPSELLVFIALSSYYNGKPVFPKITTLSANTNLSEKAVRTSLNSLIDMGYLIKSKRGKKTNSNIYNINIQAVLNTVQTGKFFHAKPVNFTGSCIEQTMGIKQQQEKKEKKEKKEVVVVSSKKHRTIKIDEVPDIIKTNKKVLNPCAYWASLSEEARNEYLQKQAFVNAAAEKKVEAKRQADLELMKQRKEAEQQAKKTITDVFSREEAIRHIIRLPEYFLPRSKLAENLIKVYNITNEELREKKETQTTHTTQTILTSSENV